MVELLHNNQPIHRWTPPLDAALDRDGSVKLHLAVGWGDKGVDVDWDVTVAVEAGELLGVEPRFRGHEIVAPQAQEAGQYAFSDWSRPVADQVAFTTRTWGNVTTTTAAAQGMGLEVQPGPDTRLRMVANGREEVVALETLRAGPHAFYLGGFLTPTVQLGRAASRAEITAAFTLTHISHTPTRDWYAVRVQQTNGQWAWSSPVCVG
jgi:hypothetical protein